MEEQRKNEFPRPQETPDWAQEALAPAKPPFSAGRKEVLLAFGMYVLAYVYLGSGWWALPLFAAGFIAAGEYLYRDVKRPWESWVWLACMVVIVGCITWRSLHPNQYDSRLDVQVMQEYAIPSSLAFLALHILAVYWLLCRSGRLTGGESGHLLPLDALYAFLIVPFQNFFLRIRCVIFALKSKKERGVSAGAIAGAVLAAFAALVLLVLAMTQLSAADDTFGELIDDLRLTLTLDLDETWFYRLLASLPVGAYVFGLLAGLGRRTPEDMRGRGAAVQRAVSRVLLRAGPVPVRGLHPDAAGELYRGRIRPPGLLRTLPRHGDQLHPFLARHAHRAAEAEADPLDGRRPSGPEHAVRRHRDLQAGAVYRLLRPHAPARTEHVARVRAAPRLRLRALYPPDR